MLEELLKDKITTYL